MANFTIVSNKGSILSAKNIAKQLMLTGHNVKVTKNTDTALGDSFLIRYGKTCFPNKDGYNDNSFIKLAGSKTLFSKFCKEHNLYAPVYYTEETPDKYPVFIRKIRNGQNAEGLIFVKNEKEFLENFEQGNFWAFYVPMEFELRVHILGGKIVRVFKKLALENPPDGIKPYSAENWPVKNNDNCHYSLRKIDNYSKLNNFVDHLHELPGWSGMFYSIDIGWDKKNKKYFFIEANSGPGLNMNSALLYSNFLQEMYCEVCGG